MNWLFGGGGSSRQPTQAHAVTGVSSDYYAHQDLPVAVAVPVGDAGANCNGAVTPPPFAAASVAPLPPPVNPAYKNFNESSHTQASSSVAPSAPPSPGNAPINKMNTAHANSAPLSASQQRQQRPTSSGATRIISPISFTVPPTIIPANNSVVMPLAVAPAPTGPMATTTIAHKQGGALRQQFAPLPLEFGRRPAFLSACPYCQSLNVRTRLQTYPSWKTWVAVLLIALVFWPLAWVPLVVDCTKTTEHYCPNCHAVVGSVDAFEDACVKRRN